MRIGCMNVGGEVEGDFERARSRSFVKGLPARLRGQTERDRLPSIDEVRRGPRRTPAGDGKFAFTRVPCGCWAVEV